MYELEARKRQKEYVVVLYKEQILWSLERN